MCIVFYTLLLFLIFVLTADKIQKVSSTDCVLDQSQRVLQDCGAVQQSRLPEGWPTAARVHNAVHHSITAFLLPLLLKFPNKCMFILVLLWGTWSPRPCWRWVQMLWRSWAGGKWSECQPSRDWQMPTQSCASTSLEEASPKDSTQTGRDRELHQPDRNFMLTSNHYWSARAKGKIYVA